MVLQPPTKPWWQFPRIDNFGLIDPAGPYYKPDTNVQVPGNYPIEDLLSGTVTSVQKGTSWGQNIITILLDNPVNSQATRTFYEHLSQVNVTPGEHVSTGQIIGYNNPSGQVPLGFGFYSGDVYGAGSAWSQLQKDLSPGGAGLLDPAPLLNTLTGGSAPPGSTTLDLTQKQILSSSSTGNSSDCVNNPPAWIRIFCALSGNNPACFVTMCSGNTPPQQAAQTVGNFFDPNTWKRVGIITFGLIIVLIGIYKIF